jgi:hypothetical protein
MTLTPNGFQTIRRGLRTKNGSKKSQAGGFSIRYSAFLQIAKVFTGGVLFRLRKINAGSMSRRKSNGNRSNCQSSNELLEQLRRTLGLG